MDVDVFEDRSRGVGGRLGDNVDVARALACARAHSTSIILLSIEILMVLTK